MIEQMILCLETWGFGDLELVVFLCRILFRRSMDGFVGGSDGEEGRRAARGNSRIYI